MTLKIKFISISFQINFINIYSNPLKKTFTRPKLSLKKSADQYEKHIIYNFSINLYIKHEPKSLNRCEQIKSKSIQKRNKMGGYRSFGGVDHP